MEVMYHRQEKGVKSMDVLVLLLQARRLRLGTVVQQSLRFH